MKNADSIGTAILPVHFSFATVKTSTRECGMRNEEILQLGSLHFAVLDYRSKLKNPHSAFRIPHSAFPTQSNPATTFSKIAQEFSHLFD